MKFLSFLIILCLSHLALAQDCPDLLAPVNGATNVPIDTSISWETVPGVTGYILSVGTTPNGTDIINEQAIGGSASFQPPLGLPDNAQIYVTITLFFFDQPDIVCTSQSFFTENIVTPPLCTALTNPLDGAVDVNVGTNIIWSYARGATGYRITIGTAIGLGDIVNDLDVGNVLVYNPPIDFVNGIDIYVQIIPYNNNGNAAGCSTESFTTGFLGTIPLCATLISPLDGAINVGLSPLIEWTAVPDAIGYIVNIGSTPFDNDVLNGGVFYTNSTFVIDFESNSIYFIQIIPFNDAGEAIGCEQTSFSTILGCGPYYNPVTGELETLNPELTLPNLIGLCLNETPTTITAPDAAEGYRWYKLNANNDFVVVSESMNVEISEEGIYKYEAYNYADGQDAQIECPSEMEFTVTFSEIATIQGVTVANALNGILISVVVTGIGDYEFALDDINGPYQSSAIFNNAPEDTSIVYVRDRKGCGIVSYSIVGYVIADGFPKFFTPNADGFNDYWQYRPKDGDDFQLKIIYIFNRYGNLIKTIKPSSLGWDGRIRDEVLPSSDFWYRAETTNGMSFTGHFSLVR